VQPRRATAFGAARHWPFAGGSLSPVEPPGVGGMCLGHDTMREGELWKHW